MYDMKPYLQKIDSVIEKGPWKDTWESLSGYRVPEWYRNAKFGIFIHWGIYSVPATISPIRFPEFPRKFRCQLCCPR